MFQPIRDRKSTGSIPCSALAIFELIYHSIVRSIRKQHNNAFIAIAHEPVADRCIFVDARST